MEKNLNNLSEFINDREGFLNEKQLNNNANNGNISVYFRDLKSNLISEIEKHDTIFGCIAWLTDFDILKALQGKKVYICVQKEDFLRPDSNEIELNPNSWKIQLQELYEKLFVYEADGSWFLFKGYNFIDHLSIASFIQSGIRCVGNYNNEKKPANPRMHNKFMIFADELKNKEYTESEKFIFPKKVWTGSFNFTNNAGYSLENAVLIDNKEIAEAYYKEFALIYSISEPLNWESEWIYPEYRLGT